MSSFIVVGGIVSTLMLAAMILANFRLQGEIRRYEWINLALTAQLEGQGITVRVDEDARGIETVYFVYPDQQARNLRERLEPATRVEE